MPRWSLLLMPLLLACGDKAAPETADDDDGIYDPLAASASCEDLCLALCEHAEVITGGAEDGGLSNEDCAAQCTEAPGGGNECRDCWVWMQEQIWDEHNVMADCYCVAKPEASNPYAEDCDHVITEYYESDPSTLEAECAEGCLQP